AAVEVRDRAARKAAEVQHEAERLLDAKQFREALRYASDNWPRGERLRDRVLTAWRGWITDQLGQKNYARAAKSAREFLAEVPDDPAARGLARQATREQVRSEVEARLAAGTPDAFKAAAEQLGEAGNRSALGADEHRRLRGALESAWLRAVRARK